MFKPEDYKTFPFVPVGVAPVAGTMGVESVSRIIPPGSLLDYYYKPAKGLETKEANPEGTAGIGDIDSEAKGSARRLNAGKPAMDLIPLRVLVEHYEHIGLGGRTEVTTLRCLALFQESGGEAGWFLQEAVGLLSGDDPEVWEECAQVLDYGRRLKYKEWNWAKGMPWSACVASAVRHLRAMLRGEAVDVESGRRHVGHLLCNLVFLLQYQVSYNEGNDIEGAKILAPQDAGSK